MSDRRDFLKNAARGIAGALLAGGTGWLALGSGEPCWTGGACRDCPELDGCEESEARIVRLQRMPTSNAREHPPTGEEPMSS
ncbi:MAG: twin-arginine translocation signal domain-containing protein [Armatimonadota bacterium]